MADGDVWLNCIKGKFSGKWRESTIWRKLEIKTHHQIATPPGRQAKVKRALRGGDAELTPAAPGLTP